ncbi:hypothetical protein SNEBB_007322 [Seison nebaliae]|nr:hypothetical protein SNEBB_007322 [Seison nebaliae]
MTDSVPYVFIQNQWTLNEEQSAHLTRLQENVKHQHTIKCSISDLILEISSRKCDINSRYFCDGNLPLKRYELKFRQDNRKEIDVPQEFYQSMEMNQLNKLQKNSKISKSKKIKQIACNEGEKKEDEVMENMMEKIVIKEELIEREEEKLRKRIPVIECSTDMPLPIIWTGDVGEFFNPSLGRRRRREMEKTCNILNEEEFDYFMKLLELVGGEGRYREISGKREEVVELMKEIEKTNNSRVDELKKRLRLSDDEDHSPVINRKRRRVAFPVENMVNNSIESFDDIINIHVMKCNQLMNDDNDDDNNDGKEKREDIFQMILKEKIEQHFDTNSLVSHHFRKGNMERGEKWKEKNHSPHQQYEMDDEDRLWLYEIRCHYHNVIRRLVKEYDDNVNSHKTNGTRTKLKNYLSKRKEKRFRLDQLSSEELKEKRLDYLRHSNKLIGDRQFERIVHKLEFDCFYNKKVAGGWNDVSVIGDNDWVCSVCLDGECYNSNVIIFCDICNIPVHQDCYGVPLVPQGQWLCKRCIVSPASLVRCVLCPNMFGAMKQTVEGYWSHITCAIWTPEVQFSNPTFFEPIVGVSSIPKSRWTLTCYICERERCGACIQCSVCNCCQAFHVTCGQRAGLHMEIKYLDKSATGTGNSSIIKIAYCHLHTPLTIKQKIYGNYLKKEQPSLSSANRIDLNEMGKCDVEKMEEVYEEYRLHRMILATKILVQTRPSQQQVLVPVIDTATIVSILVNEMKLTPLPYHVLTSIMNYWRLKRYSRNGAPLLRNGPTNIFRMTKNMLIRREDKRLQTIIDSSNLGRRLTRNFFQQNHRRHIKQLYFETDHVAIYEDFHLQHLQYKLNYFSLKLNEKRKESIDEHIINNNPIDQKKKRRKSKNGITENEQMKKKKFQKLFNQLNVLKRYRTKYYCRRRKSTNLVDLSIKRLMNVHLIINKRIEQMKNIRNEFISQTLSHIFERSPLRLTISVVIRMITNCSVGDPSLNSSKANNLFNIQSAERLKKYFEDLRFRLMTRTFFSFQTMKRHLQELFSNWQYYIPRHISKQYRAEYLERIVSFQINILNMIRILTIENRDVRVDMRQNLSISLRRCDLMESLTSFVFSRIKNQYEQKRCEEFMRKYKDKFPFLKFVEILQRHFPEHLAALSHQFLPLIRRYISMSNMTIENDIQEIKKPPQTSTITAAALEENWSATGAKTGKRTKQKKILKKGKNRILDTNDVYKEYLRMTTMSNMEFSEFSIRQHHQDLKDVISLIFFLIYRFIFQSFQTASKQQSSSNFNNNNINIIFNQIFYLLFSHSSATSLLVVGKEFIRQHLPHCQRKEKEDTIYLIIRRIFSRLLNRGHRSMKLKEKNKNKSSPSSPKTTTTTQNRKKTSRPETFQWSPLSVNMEKFSYSSQMDEKEDKLIMYKFHENAIENGEEIDEDDEQMILSAFHFSLKGEKRREENLFHLINVPSFIINQFVSLVHQISKIHFDPSHFQNISNILHIFNIHLMRGDHYEYFLQRFRWQLEFQSITYNNYLPPLIDGIQLIEDYLHTILPGDFLLTNTSNNHQSFRLHNFRLNSQSNSIPSNPMRSNCPTNLSPIADVSASFYFQEKGQYRSRMNKRSKLDLENCREIYGTKQLLRLRIRYELQKLDMGNRQKFFQELFEQLTNIHSKWKKNKKEGKRKKRRKIIVEKENYCELMSPVCLVKQSSILLKELIELNKLTSNQKNSIHIHFPTFLHIGLFLFDVNSWQVVGMLKVFYNIISLAPLTQFGDFVRNQFFDWYRSILLLISVKSNKFLKNKNPPQNVFHKNLQLFSLNNFLRSKHPPQNHNGDNGMKLSKFQNNLISFQNIIDNHLPAIVELVDNSLSRQQLECEYETMMAQIKLKELLKKQKKIRRMATIRTLNTNRQTNLNSTPKKQEIQSKKNLELNSTKIRTESSKNQTHKENSEDDCKRVVNLKQKLVAVDPFPEVVSSSFEERKPSQPPSLTINGTTNHLSNGNGLSIDDEYFTADGQSSTSPKPAKKPSRKRKIKKMLNVRKEERILSILGEER